MTFVKICGIVREEDARFAAQLGAEALGFNFVPASPRCITAEHAARMSAAVPAHVWRVGVFVDTPTEDVARIAEEAKLSALQFHGSETPEQIASFERYVRIKALRVKDYQSLEEAAKFLGAADFLLLDSFSPDVHGGSGRRIAVEVLEEAQRSGLLSKAILAGGLNPENVRDMINRFNPFGVDVASGVESAPGIKDHSLLQKFFEKI